MAEIVVFAQIALIAILTQVAWALYMINGEG